MNFKPNDLAIIWLGMGQETNAHMFAKAYLELDTANATLRKELEEVRYMQIVLQQANSEMVNLVIERDRLKAENGNLKATLETTREKIVERIADIYEELEDTDQLHCAYTSEHKLLMELQETIEAKQALAITDAKGAK